LSLVEAAMFGKPMISCEIGTGTSFINLDKVTGLVVPPANAQALAAAMAWIWTETDMAQRFGQNAVERYESLFTSEKMAASYMNLYRDLVGNI